MRKPAATYAATITSALAIAASASRLVQGFGQMVSAQNNARRIEAHLLCDAAHEAHEIRWLHAGVAAVLVDLVAGGFEQHQRIVMPQCMAQ